MDNTIVAKYLTRPIVQQRNSVTLTQWAAYLATEPIPATPDEAWIRQRIVAENMPAMLNMYTQQTLGYFLQDPATVSNILQFISEDNDSPTEATLSQSNQDICNTFMPRFGQATITEQQIQNWCTQNNVPVPSSLASRVPVPFSPPSIQRPPSKPS